MNSFLTTQSLAFVLVVAIATLPAAAFAQDTCDAAATLSGIATTIDRLPKAVAVDLSFKGESGEELSVSDAETGAFTVTLDSGVWTWEASASGYLSAEGTVSLCRSTVLDIALIPDADIVLDGDVFSGDDLDGAGSVGATIVALGRGERVGVEVATNADEEGRFTLELPAGYYDLHIDHQRESSGSIGDEHLRFDVENFELLDDTTMSFRIFSSEDRPDRDISCSSAPLGGSWMGIAIALGLVTMRRRRAC